MHFRMRSPTHSVLDSDSRRRSNAGMETMTPEAPETAGALRIAIALASRVLAREGVLDSFGHVSARLPGADTFFMSRICAPALVCAADVVEVDLDGQPLVATEWAIPRERAIHAAMFRARPDVMAVCHHHAPDILPFCISAIPLVPVCHVGATMGAQVPSWDSQHEFGDTDLLVSDDSQGRSLARALGAHWTVLMKHHGATVVGRSLQEMVFRAIHGVLNARLLLAAHSLGRVDALSAGECEATSELNLRPFVVARSWAHWTSRIGSIGEERE